tara:strand:- start:862 stop:1488 length:627 start_codon:yes stop_codon:yes gene_type:complete
MYFLKSILRLGNKYGYLNLIKIIIFEILNFKIDKIHEYKIDKPYSKGSEYYIPSFFFVLWVIKKRINLSKKIFIDIGCGKGRVLRYFLHNTKETIGIELNDEYKKYVPDNLINKVFWGDAYDNLFIENIINKYIENELVVYFYHPFEEKRINEIINKFYLKFDNLIIILVGNINLDVQNKKNFISIYNNGNLTKIFSSAKNQKEKSDK